MRNRDGWTFVNYEVTDKGYCHWNCGQWYNALCDRCFGRNAGKIRIVTGCVTCNPGTPLAAASDYPVEVIVGPEFVTGSTRMKSGTAQKLVLNMISTTVMIRIGRVEDNRMVNMQLTNSKLIERGTGMLMNQTGITDYQMAKNLLLQYGSVKKAAESGRKHESMEDEVWK